MKLRNLVSTASIATTATTAAAIIISKAETNHLAAALNATSHILWGDQAAKHDHADLEHTVAGGALNASAMGAWAFVNELLPRARTPLGAIAKGAIVSALAYVTDYVIVPKRLTPGFEKRLSPTGMLTMYATLAGALGLGEWLAQRSSVRPIGQRA
jgi:hypothetical protein